MLRKEIIGVDLGTANTLVYSSNSDSVVFNEPTCVAIDKNSHEVKEIGFLASKIQGKTPYNYEITNPVEHGFIADSDACFMFLDKIFQNLHLEKTFRNASILFSAPSQCSKVNRKALIEIAKNFQAKEIFIESQAKLAALGAGENVYAPTATLVCNIGAGITDIGVLSLGDIVSCESTFISSNTFDEAIRRYMVLKKHLQIGAKSAEYVKMRIGSVAPNGEERLVDVKGRDTITSLPSSMIVSSGELKSALIPLAEYIALKITDVIASIPPELSADLIKNGLVLTGGGSLLTGLKEYFAETLSIPVRIAPNPETAVSKGMSIFVHNLLK
ncbi:MAG: rod shape-determining protein [Bacilli bacterium]